MTEMTVEQMRFLISEFLAVDNYLGKIAHDIEDIRRRQDKIRRDLAEIINEEEASLK